MLHRTPTPTSCMFFITELPGFTRGSRMLGLMNLGGVPSGSSSQAPPPHMMPQSPINTIPRSPYNDSRLNSIQPPSQPPASFGSAGFSNGNYYSCCLTQLFVKFSIFQVI
mgnify:FL=1